MRYWIKKIYILIFFVLIRPDAWPGAFRLASEGANLNVVMHVPNYTVTGGIVMITVGINPTSENASSMEIPIQNIVNRYNNLKPRIGDLLLGATNEIPSGMMDFESVALHELGHSLGLAHSNLGSESGLSEPQHNHTRSTDGSDNNFNLDPGVDGIIGSMDDIRGDDFNLHYYNELINNPFILLIPVDANTYSRDTGFLPAGHTFVVNGDRDFSIDIGIAKTESVMQQGAFFDEDQRELAADDVATLRYAISGLDSINSTADDYSILLTYQGLDPTADIVFNFDAAATSFASSFNGAIFLATNHFSNNPGGVKFNPNLNWYFNDSVGPVELASFGLD